MNAMRSPLHRRMTVGLGLVAIAGLALAGCAEGGSSSNSSGSVSGQTVNISGGITGTEADALNKSFA